MNHASVIVEKTAACVLLSSFDQILSRLVLAIASNSINHCEIKYVN